MCPVRQRCVRMRHWSPITAPSSSTVAIAIGSRDVTMERVSVAQARFQLVSLAKPR